jgi:hypothetical protein
VTAEEVKAANRRAIAADTVEVVVLGATAPESFTVVLEADPLRRAASGEPPAAWTAPVATDGVARFTDVRPAGYRMRVRGPGGLERAWRYRLVAVPVVVVVGEGAVRGRVFDRAGSPMAGRTVELSSGAWTNLGWTPIETRTDDEGRYAFPALRSGAYTISAALSERDARVDTFALAPGESKEVDLGSSTPEPRWSGRARLATGTLLAPPTRIFLQATRGMPALWVPIEAQGTFSTRVPPGTYRGGIDFALRHFRFDVTVGAADTTQDLVVPGVRVSGTFRYGTAGNPLPTARPSAPVIRIRPASDAPPDDDRFSVVPDPAGRFSFDAVPAGRYRLTVTPPEETGAESTSLVVDVGEERDVDGLLLEVRPK